MKQLPSKRTKPCPPTNPSTMSIVLGCPCGEELFILGREEYWRKEGRTCFEGGVGGE
jgi:hypothetical protein